MATYMAEMAEDTAVFIVWGDSSPRAEDIVAHFRPWMNMRFVQYPRLRTSKLLLPLRYLMSAISTWKYLRAYRPRVIFVQNPPIFAPMIVFLYSRSFRDINFVIDSHSSCFNSPAWTWSLPLQSWLSKYASVTLIHNKELLKDTKNWTGKVLVLDDAPLKVMIPDIVRSSVGLYKIVVVSSFAWDEPLDLILSAACRIPDVEFYITGDYTGAREILLRKKSSNILFTGFLPRDLYFQHLCSANAILVLTTRDHTMQRGAWEAMYCGQPLILSDQNTLRSYFDRGTIFVSNTVEGLLDGINQMRHHEEELRDEMLSLAPIKRQCWLNQIEELGRIIALHPVST